AGGYTLYVKAGTPVYEYNYFGHARHIVTGSEKISPGPAAVRVEFEYDGGGVGKGGTATLFVNDKKVGEGRIDKSVPSRFGAETFDVGMDNGSPVSENYQPPFAYAGTIKKVEINVRPLALETGDIQTIRNAERNAALAIE